LVELVAEEADLRVMGTEMFDRQPHSHDQTDDEIAGEREDGGHCPGIGLAVAPFTQLGGETAETVDHRSRLQPGKRTRCLPEPDRRRRPTGCVSRPSAAVEDREGPGERRGSGARAARQRHHRRIEPKDRDKGLDRTTGARPARSDIAERQVQKRSGDRRDRPAAYFNRANQAPADRRPHEAGELVADDRVAFAGGTLTLGISTGNSMIDDIVDAHKAADELAAADKIWQQAEVAALPGGLDAAAALLDNAISLRPDDWRYRISRAAVAIEQGDVREFDYQLAQTNPDSQASAEAQATEQASIREQKIMTLTLVEPVMAGQFTSAATCTEFYGELRNLYQHRFDDSTHSQRDLDQVAKYDGLVKGCASLPQ